MGRLLFKLSPKLALAYWTFVAHMRYGPISNMINALYFMRLAWHFLCGRLLIVTTEKPRSNGGYRYFSIVISKRPVSSWHTYDDL
jgi:hypothetical protein